MSPPSPRWTWQQPYWPHFRYDPAPLQAGEARFLKGAGVVIGSIGYLDGDARQGLVVGLMAQDMAESSAIEGELLDRASLQSSIAGQLGFAADARRASPAEAGAAELMADLYRRWAEPLSEAQLFAWHAMLMNGRRDLAAVGAYRTHEDAMQIVSGPLHAPRVHFEAPPSARVPAEMAGFIAWFNASAPGGPAPLPAITRAAIAHLWFETIHPFEDGNGRLGRAIAEQALAQGLEAPTLTALAATIHRHRRAYYDQLHRASRDLAIDSWLAWFAEAVLEAQGRTIDAIGFLVAKTRLFDRLRDQLNPRQEKALLRMFAEGPDGFTGGLSAHNYRTITDAAPATATRDLAELVALGALTRTGERRYARYYLALDRNERS